MTDDESRRYRRMKWLFRATLSALIAVWFVYLMPATVGWYQARQSRKQAEVAAKQAFGATHYEAWVRCANCSERVDITPPRGTTADAFMCGKLCPVCECSAWLAWRGKKYVAISCTEPEQKENE